MSEQKKIRVLLIIESCNPDWASVPLVGYQFFKQIREFAHVTLVTHSRNREALKRVHPDADIVFIEPGSWESRYYRLITFLSTYKNRVIWPLRHMLQFPLYFFFDRSVFHAFAHRVKAGEFSVVHVLTPMMPRYPVKIIKACANTPMILGPVNGGVPFPPAFRSLGRKEFSQFNFLRTIGAHLIPNYRNTYKKARLILAGSSYTRLWILKEFQSRTDESVRLMFENAVPESFFGAKESLLEARSESELRLLFVGRLVPYKGAEMLIRALIDPRLKDRSISLCLVGDGSEKAFLQKLVEQSEVKARVKFAGWVPQDQTLAYYQNADVFCFPSVREFGGAVVMEAMACGLPCIVVDNGGIGEYVTEESGYKIAPLGEKYVVEQIVLKLVEILEKPGILKEKSIAARVRAREFSWGHKREELKEIYAAMSE